MDRQRGVRNPPRNGNFQGYRKRPIGLVGYSDDDEECCIDDNFHLDASGIIFDSGHNSAPTPRGLGQ